MILVETYTLSNGVTIPKLGLGTWFINNKDVVQAVKDAAKLGYRHIDTAQAYGNESGVGEGIRACGISREAMFVTTKLAAEIKSYKEAFASIDQSLKTLQLDYIDLMIIQALNPGQNSWRATITLKETVKPGELWKKCIKPGNCVALVFQTLKRQTLITLWRPVP